PRAALVRPLAAVCPRHVGLRRVGAVPAGDVPALTPFARGVPVASRRAVALGTDPPPTRPGCASRRARTGPCFARVGAPPAATSPWQPPSGPVPSVRRRDPARYAPSVAATDESADTTEAKLEGLRALRDEAR